jgi:peroxiredoxin
MISKKWVLVYCAFLVCISLKIYCQNTRIGKEVKDFSLMNFDGKMVSLSDYKTSKGVIIIFTSNHCPFAKLYPKRMNQLHAQYAKMGIPLLAISSTDTIMYQEDCFTKMKAKAIAEKFKFPYLYDGSQQVAKNFNADKTPHAFVIWKENNQWIIKYNGAIDDNGAEPQKVQNNYISNAIEELLHGKVVTLAETKSVGCKIYFRE